MKKYNVGIIALVVAMSGQLIPSYAFASHELENQGAAPEAAAPDGHISWHEFRHDLGSYSTINAVMDHHGVVTLSGHVENSTDKSLVERLASKIRGATDIKSIINVD